MDVARRANERGQLATLPVPAPRKMGPGRSAARCECRNELMARGSPTSVRLARIDELPDPGARGFDPEGAGHDTLFVVRRGAAVHAYRDACPHYGDTAMAWRKDAYLNGDGTRIVCHAHG